jgi:phospholipid transport system substrate-binding protein
MIAQRFSPLFFGPGARRGGRGSQALALVVLLGFTTVESPAAAQAAPVATPASKRVASVNKPPGEPADATGLGPMDELKRANAQLKKQLGNRKPSWSPEAQARNVEIKKIVGSFLDFEELAHRALIRHWDNLNPKQRAEFVRTLRDLVERNYVRQLYGQPDYDLQLEKEELTGNEATVVGSLQASAKGKKVTMALEYKLVKKQNKWVVFDVVTDELSLLENYRAEFNKVIAKDSFDALLSRMKKKLAESR